METEIVVAGYRWQPHFGAIICDHVFEGAEVLLVCHELNGDLQFLCGRSEGHDSCKLAGLIHVMDHHPEISSIPTVEPGQWAQRTGNVWTIGQLDSDD